LVLISLGLLVSDQQELTVDPYKNATKVINKYNGDFLMTTRATSKIQKTFTSIDGTFSVSAVAAFHTHPGWTSFPQFGTPEASFDN
jgi:hypothetical protein